MKTIFNCTIKCEYVKWHWVRCDRCKWKSHSATTNFDCNIAACRDAKDKTNGGRRPRRKRKCRQHGTEWGRIEWRWWFGRCDQIRWNQLLRTIWINMIRAHRFDWNRWQICVNAHKPCRPFRCERFFLYVIRFVSESSERNQLTSLTLISFNDQLLSFGWPLWIAFI